jgi:hypothetical protein
MLKLPKYMVPNNFLWVVHITNQNQIELSQHKHDQSDAQFRLLICTEFIHNQTRSKQCRYQSTG